MSRSLGDLEYKQNKNLPPKDQMITAYPDIVEETITPECDFMIIGCDGVWDCKTNQQACDFVRERLRKNPKAVLSKIVEELFDEIIAPDVVSKNGLGCDNMTCVIIQFKRKFYNY